MTCTWSSIAGRTRSSARRRLKFGHWLAGVVSWIAVLSTSALHAQDTPTGEPQAVQVAPPAPPGDAPSPVPDAVPPTEATPAPAPEPEPPAPPSSIGTPASDDFELSVGGGMILYWYQPLKGRIGGAETSNNFEVFEAKLRVDATFGHYGLHILPIVRDTKERGFFPGVAWIQETYAFAKFEPVTIKVGKVFAQFGRFWDNSFYGNAQEYDGLKLDPNVGFSIEGDVGHGERAGLQFFAQYFVIDGVTNYSLPGRDTISIENARRRNYIIGRVEPFVKLGELTTLKLGLSGGFFQADIPGFDSQPVGRIAVDGTVMVENFTAWAEYTHQFGNQLETSPFAGTDPDVPWQKADWMMVGGEYTYERFTVRYNFNLGSYLPIEYKETRHIPGIAVALDERLFVLLELAVAQRHNGGDTTLLDLSLNLTIHGKV
jgi:hypothetical protein